MITNPIISIPTPTTKHQQLQNQNRTGINNNNRHLCVHDSVQSKFNIKSNKHLSLNKSRKINKFVKSTLINENINNNNNRNIYVEIPTIVNETSSDINNDTDEIKTVEKLKSIESATTPPQQQQQHHLEIPMSSLSFDLRKSSMPAIRKSSHQLDIDELASRKYSINFDEKSKRYSHSRNYGSFLQSRSPSVKSRHNSQFAQFNQLLYNRQHQLSLHPPTLKNDAKLAQSQDMHSPMSVSKGRRPSINESQLQSQIEDEVTNEFKFTTNLSKTGQCAMLKSYEDELYKQLKSKCPKKHLPRVNTPTFNLNISNLERTPTLYSLPSCSSISLRSRASSMRKGDASVSSFDTYITDNDQQRKYQINRQIETAMEILDDISKINLNEEKKDQIIKERDEASTPINSRNEESPLLDTSSRYEIDSIDIHRKNIDKNKMDITIRKYEKWQRDWSKMLNEMF